MRYFFKVILFLIILFFPLHLKAEEKKIVINNVFVKNNQRIDTETILSYLNVDKGDKVNYRVLNKKLKEMYALGLFADIKLRVVNNDLIILVKEHYEWFIK